jgi:phosphohistidine phosphatase
MELLVIRHGKAEGHSLRGDGERALVSKGHAQAKHLGRLLKHAGRLPMIVLTSPLLRARQTAETLCEEAGLPGPVIQGWLACGMQPDQAWQELAAFREFERVAIVGHEPDLSGLIAFLMGCPHGAIRMKKGACAVLRLLPPAITGTLEALIPPKLADDDWD